MKLMVLYESTSAFKMLKNNKVALTDEEREKVMKAKATWNSSAHGKPTSAVWKSKDKNNKVTYVTATHRAYNTATTLKSIINKFHTFIKGTA